MAQRRRETGITPSRFRLRVTLLSPFARLPMQTASSLTVVSEEVIRSRAAQHFEDIIQAIPNVNYAAGSNRARFFQIRGIGERSQFINPVNPSIGILIDDVDFSGAGSIATMLDVAQVEVLRGPQGTRYGANALAGLIYMRSAEPTADFDGRIQVQAGDDGMLAGGVAVGGGLGARGTIDDGGRLRFRLAGLSVFEKFD